MLGLLQGKIVCITGASRGIGRACAVEAANQGATGLILHFLGDSETEAEIASLKQEVETSNHDTKVATIPGDIADPVTATKVRMAPHVGYYSSAYFIRCIHRSLNRVWRHLDA